MVRKDTEFGVDAGTLVPTVVRLTWHEDLPAAEQMREIYALDNLRDDEGVSTVDLPRRAGTRSSGFCS